MLGRIVLAGAAAALITGCVTNFTPTVVSAGDRGITYQIPADRLEETSRQADIFCKERGRTAKLERVTPAGSGRSTASFECI